MYEHPDDAPGFGHVRDADVEKVRLGVQRGDLSWSRGGGFFVGAAGFGLFFGGSKGFGRVLVLVDLLEMSPAGPSSGDCLGGNDV